MRFARLAAYSGWVITVFLLSQNYLLKQKLAGLTDRLLEKRFIKNGADVLEAEPDPDTYFDPDADPDSEPDSDSELPNSDITHRGQFAIELNSSPLSTPQKPISSAINSLLSLNSQSSKEISKISSNSDLISPKSYKSEYHVYPFTHFTLYHIEMLESNLKRHPRDVFKENPHRARDLLNIVQNTAKKLKLMISNFVEGYYRFKPDSGTEYVLFFKVGNKTVIKHIYRPFNAAIEVEKSPYNMETSNEEIIHFIVPFAADGDLVSESASHASHVNKLKEFLLNFKEAVDKDKNVFLTLVWVTEKNQASYIVKKQLETSMGEFLTSNTPKAEILIVTSQKFARGLALDHGIKHGKHVQTANLESKTLKKSRLLFFCDIDVHFQLQFLDTCRRSAVENRVVFYPVVFSLYNPTLVYHALGKNGKSAHDRTKLRRVHKDHGFWRDFGFGMSCQYQKDYTKIGGFDLSLHGWGLEDVLLYRKYASSSSFSINRAPVPSLFHDWHEKHCEMDVEAGQVKSCVKSKSVNEGSQVQLGELLFMGEAHRKKIGWG